MWTYAFLFRSLIVGGDTWLPYNASVMFSTRRTETPARNISMRAFSTRFPCGDTAPWSPFQKKSPWVRRLEHDISRSGEVTSVVAGSFVLPAVYCRLYPYGLTPTSSGRRAHPHRLSKKPANHFTGLRAFCFVWMIPLENQPEKRPQHMLIKLSEETIHLKHFWHLLILQTAWPIGLHCLLFPF